MVDDKLLARPLVDTSVKLELEFADSFCGLVENGAFVLLVAGSFREEAGNGIDAFVDCFAAAALDWTEG